MIWLKLDFHSGEPVYQQIVSGYKSRILAGLLKKDEMVPSIRELAKELKVNPNTVARAYRELEVEGFIYSRPGVGNFIKMPDKDELKQRVKEEVKFDLEETMTKAKNYNLSKNEIIILIDETLNTIYGGE
ncbi:Transcriptional regulator, GntR family [Candidatus Syntrophocurvum alkaliphilum]|uniref:Transcriptional regulator, GntR family n=1 Tax=Candidatus Syntrophocurvum alkaliphilum TaxID=2293317 RepID=A0A6I6DIN0_9FIRM|nr:GntR family transcriptional regulator [Candidatus Syntrophocurvum alkaliphilum]QGU00714.1 Transcriptional regulator, GntR family [Candidatus Syntrophocurvum alkaliphilum]